ncbi:MAG: hypothetical protein M1818_004129 [Claussenomyces sp. TS43310]|nr:MAG: hypothetical protein M1818_004129 [Claussenomyces sp. TS43310]
MKIQHTTYDASRPRSSVSRPGSAKQRLKDYFHDRIGGSSAEDHDGDQVSLIQLGLTYRPSASAAAQGRDSKGMQDVNSLFDKQKQSKRKQHEMQGIESVHRLPSYDTSLDAMSGALNGKMTSSPRSGKLENQELRSFHPLQDLGAAVRQNSTTVTPLLKRKDKFCWEQQAVKNIESEGRSTLSADDYLAKLRARRAASAEKLLPPLPTLPQAPVRAPVSVQTEVESSLSADAYLTQLRGKRAASAEKLLPPPPALFQAPVRRSSSRKRQSTSPPRPPNHRKSSSRSSKLGSYLSASADLLDATRRDLTSQMRRGAERALSGFELPARSSHDRRAGSDEDSDSDESFFCIGETPRPTLAELGSARRLSGASAARDPWTDGFQDECRLCHKKRPGGVRGLCRSCEEEYRRPKTVVGELGDGNDEDEVERPRPLRIRKQVLGSMEAYDGEKEPFFERAAVVSSSATDRTKRSRRLCYPHIAVPEQHISQCMRANAPSDSPESATRYVSKFERWQTVELRAEYERLEEAGGRWSESLLDESDQKKASLREEVQFDEGNEDEDDLVPLIRSLGQEEPRAGRGQCSLYGSWNDIL